MGYGYKSDIPSIKGYISKNTVLQYYSEAKIFSLVFGFEPEIHEYVISPFREDNNPSCWFSIAPSGSLRFVDFANKNTVYGIKMSNIDCFDAIQVFFKIPNFYLVLRFILNNLKGFEKDISLNQNIKKSTKERVEMFFQGRNFVEKDAAFWSAYGISKANLVEDGVFPVSRIIMKNTRNGDVNSLLRETCYVYTGFEDRLKFYFPFRTDKKQKFLTNCTQNDIGHLNKLPPYGRQLIITKAYKCRRVLLNTGRISVWNQNEGMEPDDEVLFSTIKGFDQIIIFYDNDEQGILSSKALATRINNHYKNKARPLWIPETLLSKGIKDPSDFRKKSDLDFNIFLKNSCI